MDTEPCGRTTEYHELLGMIEEIKKRLEVLESPECNTKKRPKDVSEVILFCAKCGLSESDARWLYAKMECSGWRNSGKVVRNWHSLITAWKIACIFPSQKQVIKQTSVRDIESVIKAKQSLLDDIRNKYSSETASGRKWMPTATQEIRLQALSISREIKDLTTKLAQLA